MNKSKLQQTLPDGRNIYVWGSNNSRAKNRATVALVEPGHKRASQSKKQTGVIRTIETRHSAYGHIVWDMEMEAELLDGGSLPDRFSQKNGLLRLIKKSDVEKKRVAVGRVFVWTNGNSEDATIALVKHGHDKASIYSKQTGVIGVVHAQSVNGYLVREGEKDFLKKLQIIVDSNK